MPYSIPTALDFLKAIIIETELKQGLGQMVPEVVSRLLRDLIALKGMPTEVRAENGKPIRHGHDGGIPLEDDERVEDDIRERICAIERGECWETVKEVDRAWKRLGDEEAEVHVLRTCEEY
ncbi:hypothetical protein EDD18DRAFT_1115843 [Armillaria luteobubalina]|uniref:Uncharacterized protein n=1 Tax=Armillaria luteobubalina TaxID=153913 RepID=A0AA39P2T2_9AGAR|nr:hypothetical protein EDD18DRAFT_1115843 [Armillaria luteobubalina]